MIKKVRPKEVVYPGYQFCTTGVGTTYIFLSVRKQTFLLKPSPLTSFFRIRAAGSVIPLRFVGCRCRSIVLGTLAFTLHSGSQRTRHHLNILTEPLNHYQKREHGPHSRIMHQAYHPTSPHPDPRATQHLHPARKRPRHVPSHSS